MTPRNPRLVPLTERADERGRLVVLQPGDGALDFDIKRVFYLFGVPEAQRRGAHAHRRIEQLMVAVHGSVDVMVDDGASRTRFRLEDPAQGLHIPAMHWGELERFSPGAVCLVLASEAYDEAEYLRDYDEFLRLARVHRARGLAPTAPSGTDPS